MSIFSSFKYKSKPILVSAMIRNYQMKIPDMYKEFLKDTAVVCLGRYGWCHFCETMNVLCTAARASSYGMYCIP